MKPSMSMVAATTYTVLGQRAGALRQVFRHLPPRDLKKVVLVSRMWREVGEAPGLWAWVQLHLTRENIDRMWEVVGSRRLACVQVINVQEYLPAHHLWQLEPILTAVWEGVTCIKKLHISNINLSTMDPALLACAVGLL